MTRKLFEEDAYRTSCSARVLSHNEQGICLDQTIFYPEGGGQPGDCGRLVLEDGNEISICDTKKGGAQGEIRHLVKLDKTPPGASAAYLPPGTQLTAAIDWQRRHRLMRMHSCMHILCALVPFPVTGGQVGESKSRLDFKIDGEIPDKESLTLRLNAIISEDHPLISSWISDAELAANPELVRTMSVKPPSGSGKVRLMKIEDVDLQPCGGTHVRSTGEIGLVTIGKMESKGKNNRRIHILFAE